MHTPYNFNSAAIEASYHILHEKVNLHGHEFVYLDSLKGMLARIISADQNFVILQSLSSDDSGSDFTHRWLVQCEACIGAMLFNMDSSFECFVYALNAFGWTKFPTEFIDFTNERIAQDITPKCILGGRQPRKQNGSRTLPQTRVQATFSKDISVSGRLYAIDMENYGLP